MRLKGRWTSSALRLAPEKASCKSAFSPGCPPGTNVNKLSRTSCAKQDVSNFEAQASYWKNKAAIAEQKLLEKAGGHHIGSPEQSGEEIPSFSERVASSTRVPASLPIGAPIRSSVEGLRASRFGNR